jgi:hypothetical protein
MYKKKDIKMHLNGITPNLKKLIKDNTKDKKRLNFNISQSEYEDLEKICNEFNITKTDFLRLMIKNTIINL